MNIIFIMNQNNIYDLDLNLLKTFDLLMHERRLTEVARRLAVGQPAVSHALARLRRHFGDDLFVRAGRRMEPTPLARVLHAEIGPALARLEGALVAARADAPPRTDHLFRLAVSDDLQMTHLPALMADVRAAVPGARLVIHRADYLRAGDLLRSGRVDTVIGYLDGLPANAKVRKIIRVGYRVVSGGGSGPVRDLDDYCARAHGLVTFAGDLVGYVDETLENLGRRRVISVSVDSFAVLPEILRTTPLSVTVPAYLAEVLGREAGIDTAPLPFASPEFDVSMAWRAVTDKDPAERLLRAAAVRVLTGA